MRAGETSFCALSSAIAWGPLLVVDMLLEYGANQRYLKYQMIVVTYNNFYFRSFKNTPILCHVSEYKRKPEYTFTESIDNDNRLKKARMQ